MRRMKGAAGLLTALLLAFQLSAQTFALANEDNGIKVVPVNFTSGLQKVQTEGFPAAGASALFQIGKGVQPLVSSSQGPRLCVSKPDFRRDGLGYCKALCRWKTDKVMYGRLR